MKEEIESLKENDVYELTDLPNGKHAFRCIWVYENGKEKKCNAQLVAKGFTQKFGPDYDEVSSPIAKHVTIRAFLTWAVHTKAKVFQFEVKTVFLHGRLNDEELYMRQPEGFEDEDKVCNLKKSIYGFKQAAKCWNEELENTLKSYGFTQSKADSFLFTKGKSEKTMHLILYVDDILISSKDEDDK